MTDKQIIIDGVDVSGCLFYQANFEEDYDVKIKHYCSNWHNSCESNNNSNCYYKNWQRKEQECERLKKDNKELQYQLRCTTGREKEWERNCKFWDARCEKLQTELDQLQEELTISKQENEEGREINAELKAEQNIIKAVCENHFDEYEMGCLNLSEAIESLLERYDNAITRLMKDRKELKAENTKLKNNITSFNYLDSLTNEQLAVLYTASIDELAIRGYKAKYNTEVSLLTRYKQALTEIKEIAEKQYHTKLVDKDCINCDESFAQILQKCEVLDEN